ncbi:hypothetical protein M758_5G102000 [Ceratodon purpureus]|nr:hypothetical protein M758_5G102000 [Ceratodon purpureus]
MITFCVSMLAMTRGASCRESATITNVTLAQPLRLHCYSHEDNLAEKIDSGTSGAGVRLPLPPNHLQHQALHVQLIQRRKSMAVWVKGVEAHLVCWPRDLLHAMSLGCHSPWVQMQRLLLVPLALIRVLQAACYCLAWHTLLSKLGQDAV